LKLLGQSLAQKWPDGHLLAARRYAHWVVGHDLLVQLPHSIGDGRLIEKNWEGPRALGAASHNPALLHKADVPIELRTTHDSLAVRSDLNEEKSPLTITAKPAANDDAS
jgi:hypothetical protein